MIVYLKIKAWLEDGKDVRLGEWKAAEVEILNTFQLLTAKPVVYLVSYSLARNSYRGGFVNFLYWVHIISIFYVQYLLLHSSSYNKRM